MKKTTFDFGWVNGLTPERTEELNLLYKILDKDPKTVKKIRSIGRFSTETTLENETTILIYKTDIS